MRTNEPVYPGSTIQNLFNAAPLIPLFLQVIPPILFWKSSTAMRNDPSTYLVVCRDVFICSVEWASGLYTYLLPKLMNLWLLGKTETFPLPNFLLCKVFGDRTKRLEDSRIMFRFYSTAITVVISPSSDEFVGEFCNIYHGLIILVHFLRPNC